MRPSLLDPLFASAESLAGIGPKMAVLLAKALGCPANGAGARVVDLLFHLPTGTIDRRERPKIAEAPLDKIVTLEVTVVEHRAPPARSKAPYRVLVEDETGDVLLVFFLTNAAWIERSLPCGAKRWVSGKLELWDGHRQMVHPDRVLDAQALAAMPPVEPVYPATEGLSQRQIGKAIEAAFAKTRLLMAKLPEWHDLSVVKLPVFPSFGQALEALHHPAEPEAIGLESPARQRLALDELLASQLTLALMRGNRRRMAGRIVEGDGSITEKLLAGLPYRPTPCQEKALAEIRADLAAPRRMLRLLQGDVGAGKTLVALLAMAGVVEAGRQAALMAPTEILARQHHATLTKLCADTGLRLALLTGRDKGAARARLLAALAAGEIDILIGTHALFQEDVVFHDLGLAIVDEQHRFGVHQRLALSDKGEAVDILVMTATPIPRTLVLTYFGDMDVSVLREKPPGREKIDTRALPIDRIDEVVNGLHRLLAKGGRAYWVCPLVEESEALDVAAAEARFEDLASIFKGKVALLHGRMKAAEKDAAMAAFASGEASILVATTVIEVGVDVPEATVIIIEHAERFGLAQLHQLRGRVGRGPGKSSCLLLYKAPLGEIAKARIAIMRDSEDGFRIAEEDLRLRGEGDILGTKQSGLPGFRLADLSVHTQLLALARAEARHIVDINPRLEGAGGEALRVLLNLFERREAVRLLDAG